MPIHPAPPEDRDGLLDAFEQNCQAIIELGMSCRESDFDIQTECPGWTVKDQIAHVVGAEKSFAGIPTPRVEVPDYPYIRNEFGRRIEHDVEARRGIPGKLVVHELADHLPIRMAALRASATPLDEVIGGIFGPETTFGEQLRRRVLDTWVHEQDIRAALDRPGNLDSPGAAVFVDAVFRILPRIIARDAQVPIAHAVVLDVTGPLMARDGARVVAGEDSRPIGEPLFSGTEPTATDELPRITGIKLTTESLTRRAAGRRSTDEIRYTVHGDEQVAARVLDALVITP
ncbi:MAG: maleylpyruvate isomerase family mycothiol-dependent enzyme [Intrasporangium sp.]|uniref:maleylpyruvate isomerase family mycothiol-dependent enzyme n=1 Tax=Intrasporangium sp. TaxID=1925024 RepID=UPI00264A2B31|nr:maleylpyruvate isomerase family mycothiol-dependent enzyme [Intrasporangium sp.]MDN5796642.1 maleylpyruvate isomerase family mycothiol-dependent enzyme [Intrasporangium sp.]